MIKAFEYRDLLVSVWWDPTPGFFTAKAVEEFGRSTPPVQIQLPFFDRQFVGYVDRLGRLSSKELRYVGSRLFDSLFQGEILRLYLHLREQTRPAGSKLRIRLNLGPSIAARLPWECLYDTRHDTFLLNSLETTVVRFYEQATEPFPVAVRLPLRVLVAAASPSRTGGYYRVAREAPAVSDVIRSLEAEGLFVLQEAGSCLGENVLTRQHLARLVERDVDVLHLVTECRRDSDEARVVLEDEQGDPDLVSSEDFAELLKGASPRLVVLSGGEGIGATGPDLAVRLLGVAPAFVAQRGNSPDELVLRFTESFYRSLAALKPMDSAVSDALAEVVTHFPLESGWLAPALYLSRRDARVFFNEARERVQQVYQLSEGRYRRNLRETLNRVWPKPERYARQLLRWKPRREPLTSILQSVDFLEQPRTPAELAERFQRLLLVGEPGAGKTMTLYRLFYETAQRILSYSVKSPLPIYVSLPDLPARTNLIDYVSRGLDRDLFLKDLEEGRFLFLMDGLDGLSSPSAKRLTASLNAFMRRYSMNRFVVAARQILPVPLDIPNRVEFVPFSQSEAFDFLTGDRSMRAEPAKLLYHQLSQTLGPKVGNPHLLTMARRLWREGASIPKSASGLYLAFFRVAGAALDEDLREGLLPRLALFMSQGDHVSVTRQQLADETGGREEGGIARWLGIQKMTASTADELLTELGKTRLLRGPNAFSFPSLGFQEFLTGLALRECGVDEILDLIAPAQWASIPTDGGRPYNLRRGPFHGAVPFLSGFLEDSSELIEKLIERDLFLACECYREANNKEAIDDGLRAALQHAITSSDALLQSVGCLSLEARGDRWAIGILEQIATNPRAAARTQALEALGKLGSHRSLPLLKAAAQEEDPGVARAALDALSRIKAS